MRQLPLIAILTIAGCSSALCQHRQNLSHEGKAAVEQELIRLEKKWNQAFMNKDVATLRSIMADDIIIIYGDGSPSTREQDISNIGKDEQIESSTQDEFQVRLYGNAAVVLSRLTSSGTREGKKFRGQFRYVDVFEKRKGKWQCVVTQNTQIGKLRQ